MGTATRGPRSFLIGGGTRRGKQRAAINVGIVIVTCFGVLFSAAFWAAVACAYNEDAVRAHPTGMSLPGTSICCFSEYSLLRRFPLKFAVVFIAFAAAFAILTVTLWEKRREMPFRYRPMPAALHR